MTTAIKIENLGKKYIIGHQRQERYIALRDVLMHKVRGVKQRITHPLSPNKENIDIEEFWALKDINLEIKQGDRVGIIGRNGAGKSTLLKVLSRITEPTTGRIQMNGRVSSLLEVGTGFHPELTGRENIFLNGAILGMKRREINGKFDEIVAFAEVEKFLDTPVKRYSSGMYVRLAFAVAAHLEPEILIIDEVLAVGDTHFQKKCLGKMEDASKDGRTILFVSHNLGIISALCNKAIFLEQGKIIFAGPTSDTIKNYQTTLNDNTNKEYGEKIYSNLSSEASGVELISIKTLGNKQEIKSDFLSSEAIKIEIGLILRKEIPYLKIGIDVKSETGTVIFNSFHNDNKEIIKYPTTHDIIYLYVTVPPNFLNGGSYLVAPTIGIHRKEWLIKGIDGPAFHVDFSIPNPDYTTPKRRGVVSPIIEWTMTNNQH